MRKLSSEGEDVRVVKEPLYNIPTAEPGVKRKPCAWQDAPALYHGEAGLCFDIDSDHASIPINRCQCFEARKGDVATFYHAAGITEGFSLYVESSCFKHRSSGFLATKTQSIWTERIETAVMLKHLSSPGMKHVRLCHFLSLLSKYDYDIWPADSKLPKPNTFLHEGTNHRTGITSLRRLQKKVEVPASFIKSVRALSFANRVYDGMTTASVPLKIVEQPLHEHPWIPEAFELSLVYVNQPSQAQAFACILTFETGGLRSNPSELDSVMAISSRNSIFIGGALLSDPSERTKTPDIRRVVGNVGKPDITLLVSPQTCCQVSQSRF